MKNTKKFTLTAMFLAILLLLASVPLLGFIPIGPINATTMHIPVIIASIVLGPKIGGSLGGVFGLISMIRSTIIVTPASFVFSPFVAVFGTEHGSLKALLIAFIPRILIGIVPYFVYTGLTKLFKSKKQPVSLFIAGLAGSFVNTFLVMNMIYFLFGKSYGEAIEVAADAVYGVILGIIFTSGVIEAIVAAFLTMFICSILLRLMKNNPTHYLS